MLFTETVAKNLTKACLLAVGLVASLQKDKIWQSEIGELNSAGQPDDVPALLPLLAAARMSTWLSRDECDLLRDLFLPSQVKTLAKLIT